MSIISILLFALSPYLVADSHLITPSDTKQNKIAIAPEPFGRTSKVTLPSPQTAKTHQTSNEETPENGSHNSVSSNWIIIWKEKLINDPIVLFTLVLAAFTVMLSLDTRGLRKVAQKQAKDTQKSLDIAKQAADAATDTVKAMKDTSERQLRAYLVIDGILTINCDKRQVPQALHEIVCQIKVTSVGQTPATVFDAFINVRVIGSNDPFPDGGTAIRPNRNVFVTVGTGNPQIFAQNKIDRQTIIEIFTGLKKVYFFYVVRYLDIFGKEREIVSASQLIVNEHPETIEKVDTGWHVAKDNRVLVLTTVPNFGHST